MNSSFEMLEVIAGGLRDLLDEVVFVGGATVALYATDPAAPETRPTDDVDFVSSFVLCPGLARKQLELNKHSNSNAASSQLKCVRSYKRAHTSFVIPRLLLSCSA
jgi:hypothetical protein